MSNKKTLKFNQDALYNGEVVHKSGSIKELDNEKGMADRWIKRGIAVEHHEEKKSEAKEAPKKEEPKESHKPAHQENKNHAPSLANHKDGKDNKAEKDL